MRLSASVLMRVARGLRPTLSCTVPLHSYSRGFVSIDHFRRFTAVRRLMTVNEMDSPKIQIDAEKFFQLDKIDDNVYRSTHLRPGSPRFSVVYGGLLFAQALAAAEETVHKDMRVHSLHSMFILAASTKQPVDYHVRIVRDGRSFCTRVVEARQGESTVFICQMSFHAPEDAAVEHQLEMPSVPPPEACEELFDGIRRILKDDEEGRCPVDAYRKERLTERLHEREKFEAPLFEMKPTKLDEFLALKRAGKRSYVWVRSSQRLSDDPRIHRMMLVYNTDSTLAGVALKPHQSEGFIPSMLFSLDHTAWLHRDDYRADEWMLYENSTSIAGGRAFCQGRLWTVDGRLVCTTSQECLIRSKTDKSKI